MISGIQQYFAKIPAVFIDGLLDGLLYMLIAFFAFNQSYFGSDEAAKFLNPEHLFWLNFVIGSLAAIFLSIKMYRSTAYADHQQDKKAEK